MNQNNRFFVPAYLWFILSIVLLMLPGSILPKENWLDKIWADKWIHIILFGVLIILWLRAFNELAFEDTRRRKIYLLLVLSGIAYGIIMEFVQKYLIPNRSFDIADIVADTFGCVAGLLYGMRKYLKK